MRKNKHCSRLISVMLVMGFVMAQGAFAQASDFEVKNGVLVKYNGYDGNVIIPAGITSIGDGAFYMQVSLNQVTIPEGVTSIGKEAFYMCISLSAVSIPEGVTSIGDSAFGGCVSLTSVTIPDSVTAIGSLAFSTTGLKTVSLSRKTKLGDNSFPDTARLVYRDAEGSAAAKELTAEDYNRRGLASFNKKDYDSAMADYSQAIRLNPNYGDAYLGRGTTWYVKKDYDRAIADFTQAIRLVPNYANLYSARANAYAAKNNFAQAKADWEKALEIDPNNANALNNLDLLRQLGY